MGCWQQGLSPSHLERGWQCPDHWAEQDARGKEQEWMPPILRETPSQRSPSPILRSHPNLCHSFTCWAAEHPEGVTQHPRELRTHHPAVLTGSGVWGCPWHDSESSGSRWQRPSWGFPHRRSAAGGELRGKETSGWDHPWTWHRDVGAAKGLEGAGPQWYIKTHSRSILNRRREPWTCRL